MCTKRKKVSNYTSGAHLLYYRIDSSEVLALAGKAIFLTVSGEAALTVQREKTRAALLFFCIWKNRKAFYLYQEEFFSSQSCSKWGVGSGVCRREMRVRAGGVCLPSTRLNDSSRSNMRGSHVLPASERSHMQTEADKSRRWHAAVFSQKKTTYWIFGPNNYVHPCVEVKVTKIFQLSCCFLFQKTMHSM